MQPAHTDEDERGRPAYGAARRLPSPPVHVAALCVAAAALLSMVTGCASRPPVLGFWERSELDLVWPAPPDAARIAYLGELRSERDLGKHRSWLRKLAERIVGESPMSLVRPLAVARDQSGLLVVADPGIPTVHFFDLERREHRWLSEDLSLRLRAPVGVALDGEGRVYVADSVAHRIFVFDRERRFVSEFGEDLLQRPTGMAIDSSRGRLYVVDSVGCEVLVFSLDGLLIGRFGSRGAGPGQFNAPTYVAVGPEGRVAVSDSLNFRVQTFEPDGTLLGSFGRAGNRAGRFARPKGVAYDRHGRLYVADGGFDNVQIFDSEGRLLLVVGASGQDAGAFNLPVGLFMDSTQTIWVADSYNSRVQAFRLLEEEAHDLHQ